MNKRVWKKIQKLQRKREAAVATAIPTRPAETISAICKPANERAHSDLAMWRSHMLKVATPGEVMVKKIPVVDPGAWLAEAPAAAVPAARTFPMSPATATIQNGTYYQELRTAVLDHYQALVSGQPLPTTPPAVEPKPPEKPREIVAEATAISCGVKLIPNIHKWMKRNELLLKDAYRDVVKVWANWGDQFEIRPACLFVIFSDADYRGNGTSLANFIKACNFGSVTEQQGNNPNSNNDITLYTWTPDFTVYNQWALDQGIDVLAEFKKRNNL